MALTPLFNASQSSGLPSTINIVDVSTGSDNAITQRRVFLQQSDGTYLVPTGTSTNYVPWAYANSSIAINCLSQDTALSITVQWLNVSNTVLYSLTTAYGFTAYNETFYYGLTQQQIANPGIINDTNYFNNKMALRVYIDSGNQAISFASDIFSAQFCYDQATNLVTNATFNF